MTSLPVLSVGWLMASELPARDASVLAQAIERVAALLRDQFPEFEWRFPRFERPLHGARGAVDPLPLLELGAEEKLLRRADYVLVVTATELVPRTRIFVTGVPSSPLEVAVLSTRRLMEHADPADGLAALALHLLGHLFGLSHDDVGVMAATTETDLLSCAPYPPAARAAVRARLAEAADARVEETGSRGSVSFYWRTLVGGWRGIAADIAGNAPWRMPVHLGRYTAATAVTMVFLFLSAEAWELGAQLPPALLATGVLLVVLGASASLYLGQNLHQMGRVATRREQLARTHLVLWGSLLVGTASLWLTLLLIGLGAMALFPRAVFASWTGLPAEELSLLHHTAFMATLGVVAAAFGGNLEEEAEIKAVLLFDEET